MDNPALANIVRLFLVVILGLGGYIWKTEMDHVNTALADIKSSVNANIRRQWEEVNAVKKEIWQVNREVNRILYRTNEMLLGLLESRPLPPRRNGSEKDTSLSSRLP